MCSNVLFEETYSAWGAYSVPVIFYKPDNSLAKLDNGISQQIDIMPSVLSYLGYSKPFLAFGRDVFSQEQKPFAFNFNNVYQFFQDEYLLVFDGQKSIALYDFENDKLLKKNLLSERKEIADNMEIQIKAIIQQYNNRLIDNKMVVK